MKLELCSETGAPICPACGKVMAVRSAQFGEFFGCVDYPGCQVTCGYKDGKPYGRAAGPKTRTWRRKAHAAFDPIWKEGHMKRRAAYALLAEKMGMTKDECHMINFGIAECQKVIKISRVILLGFDSGISR